MYSIKKHCTEMRNWINGYFAMAENFQSNEKHTKRIKKNRSAYGLGGSTRNFVFNEGFMVSLFALSPLVPSTFNEIEVDEISPSSMPYSSGSIQDVGTAVKNLVNSQRSFTRETLKVLILYCPITIIKKLQKYPGDAEHAKGFIPYTPDCMTIWNPVTDESAYNFIHGASIIDTPEGATVVLYVKSDNRYYDPYLEAKGVPHAIKTIASCFLELSRRRLRVDALPEEFVNENKKAIDFANAIDANERGGFNAIEGPNHDALISEIANAYNDLLNQYIADAHLMEISMSGIINSWKNTIKGTMGTEVSIKREIERCQSNIENYIAAIKGLYKNINDYNLRLIGLGEMDKTITKSIENVLATLDKCPYATRFTPSQSGLIVHIVRDTDISNLKKFKECYYNQRKTRYTAPQVKAIEALMKVFSDKRLTLITRADINIDLSISRVQNAPGVSTQKEQEIMPHPHIVHFNCFGTFNTPIAQAFGEGDFQGVLELCFEACSGINWADSPVVNRTINDAVTFYDKDDRRTVKFEKEDGTIEFLNFKEVHELAEKEAAEKGVDLDVALTGAA